MLSATPMRTQYPYQTLQLGRLSDGAINGVIAALVVGGGTAGYLLGKKKLGATLAGSAAGLVAGVVAGFWLNPIGNG